MKYPKFTIYYQPPVVELTGLKSLSLSFSRMDDETNTYKQKLIAEEIDENGIIQKYKISEFHIGADKIKEKIDKIDFDRKYDPVIYNDVSPVFYIRYDDKSISTSNYSLVKDILLMFRFDRMTAILRKHYQYIPDLYEYLELQDLLFEKSVGIPPQLRGVYFNLLDCENPYKVFQSMGWLNQFLADRESVKEKI